MAPVDAEFGNSNVKPLFLVGSHAAIIAALFVHITRFIAKAHRETPPAQHTRQKHTLHRYGVALFSVLTAVSLLITTYHALAWRYASYTNWASVSRVEVPNTLWGGWYASQLDKQREGTLLSRVGASGWQLGRWMQDTDVVYETNAVAFGNPTAFWWTYQGFVGLIIWSTFVGIEGRHRNIPQSITLSFILLAQLTGLSTAQNLFFILLLLTPLPLVNGVPATEDGTLLVPHNAILSIPALLSFIVLSALPLNTERSIFTSLTTLGYFIMPMLLTSLAQPNALHAESKYKTTAAARKSYEDVFRVLAFASIGLHGYFTFKALSTDTPPHSYFRHNFVWNTYEPATSRKDQAWATFVKIIGALSENPVVSQIGWDILFSAISLCIWTVSHGVDVMTMLRCSCLAWTLPRARPLSEEESSAAKVKIGNALEDLKDEISVTATPGAKRRGRLRKTSQAIANDHVSSTAATPTRRSRRGKNDDDEYRPPGDTQAQVDRYDLDEPGDPGAAKETEAAALGWGLYVLGGLGAVSASVFGAEASGR